MCDFVVLLCVFLICIRGRSGDGCLTSSILFKYERSMGICLF